VKVKSGKSNYTMKAGNPAATAAAGPNHGGTLGSPQWSVLEFDLAKKKKANGNNVPEPATAPPPPPLVPTSK
jgi:hypothetical protein